MAQVPFSVAAQVTAETQKLARQAKSFSGLKNAQIESKLAPSGVVSDKGGAHFSQLLVGKKSKLEGLVNFHNALQKEKLIPPSGSTMMLQLGRFELEEGVLPASKNLDLSPYKKILDQSKIQLRADWKLENSKAVAIEKAKDKAVAALLHLADIMESSPKFVFDLLYDEPPKQDGQNAEFHLPYDRLERTEQDKLDDQYMAELQEPALINDENEPVCNPSLADLDRDEYERWANRPSTIRQVREIAGSIMGMKSASLSGWDYSSPKPKTGAKVVQTESDSEDKRSELEKIKKTKIL